VRRREGISPPALCSTGTWSTPGSCVAYPTEHMNHPYRSRETLAPGQSQVRPGSEPSGARDRGTPPQPRTSQETPKVQGQGWLQLGELGLAFVLAALIGFEREIRHGGAGLCTYTLVGFAAAFTVRSKSSGLHSVKGALWRRVGVASKETARHPLI
jgi:hypothetical protein